MNPTLIKTTWVITFLPFLITLRPTREDQAFPLVDKGNTIHVNNLQSPFTLPLTLIYFRATKTNNGKVELTWKTAQEMNVSHFTIERSEDGRTWVALANKPAKGLQGSVETYSYTDATPGKEDNYYRLYVTDLDSKSDYSPVRFVSFRADAAMRLYPTPAKANTNIYVEGVSPEIALVEVYNNSGRLVIRERLYSNFFNLTGLRSGIYHARITDVNNNDLIFQQKIMIY